MLVGFQESSKAQRQGISKKNKPGKNASRLINKNKELLIELKTYERSPECMEARPGNLG